MSIPTRSLSASDPAGAPKDAAWAAAAAVVDPELPVLTIEDLGVLREVTVDNGAVTVTVTPTYSGCPAIESIQRDVEAAVRAAGFAHVEVRRVLAPAWTTEWMSVEARRKLEMYGVAPPGPTHQRGAADASGPVPLRLSVRCPQCGSPDTAELSRFGSTSCKSLWRCNACKEPFDHFKAF